MAFNSKYNNDNSIQRSCIVSVLNILNTSIYFENIWADDKKQFVRVPFFYAKSGDERFLQDYFSNWSDCYPNFIEGNTDPIPRGVIWLTGSSIISANLTSRFVRGYYDREVEGELKNFNSYINSIPIQLNFSAEILYDSTIDSFKIVESIWENLYRTVAFSTEYKGFRVPTVVGFPDSYNSSKQFEYTYGATDRLKISFEIEVQTFMPIIDKTQERLSVNKINSFEVDIKPNNDIVETSTVKKEHFPKFSEIDIRIEGITGTSSGSLPYVNEII